MKKTLLATMLACAFGAANAADINLSHFQAAHKDGFLGQGTIIGTTNAHPALSNFAPLAQVTDVSNGNFNGSFVARTSEVTRAAEGTTYDHSGRYKTSMDAVVVKGGSVLGGESKVYYNALRQFQYYSPEASAKVATFGEIAGCQFCSNNEKEAYLAGSTSVLMSKFTDMKSAQVVQKMDESRNAVGAFNLEQALAPAVLK